MSGGTAPRARRDECLFARVDGELHGYGLVKAVERESASQVRMHPATLYRALKRLERHGRAVRLDPAGMLRSE